MKHILLLLALLLIPAYGYAQEIPRVIIALYDPAPSADIRYSLTHSLAEMPLNHLGLTVEYHRIDEPLPEVIERADVRGVITWFGPDTKISDPDTYLAWIKSAVEAGKKYVILGQHGAYFYRDGSPVPLARINQALSAIGFTSRNRWVETTYRVAYDYREPALFLSDAPYDAVRPPYEAITAGTDAHIYLSAREPDGNESDIMFVTPHGGYAAGEYLFRTHAREDADRRQWVIDALAFFRDAFATDDLPKPDTTTLAGRRIFYSHIDGDGWNNVSQIEEYQSHHTLSAEVIMERAVKAYPDLPVTLTLIAADIDPAWVGSDKSRDIARAFFTLPQVEAGTHTYSHPFDWHFFEDGKWQKELPYLSRYPFGHWDARKADAQEVTGEPLMVGYETPRAFANEPFDLTKEVTGSIETIGALLPKGKNVELLTWSGNCLPWEKAVALTRTNAIRNINGGDSRFDAEYPTYASLAPIGKQVGSERQIYASMSNENTYTNLWSSNFYGYALLTETLENSETPVRLKPINIYYHIYSGEKPAGLAALLHNLNYAHAQALMPIRTSHYIDIAKGFYTATLTPLSEDSWKVEHQGRLQTIRFDHASDKMVDFTRAKGVIGANWHQGSLYVYLDEAEKTSVIALKSVNLPSIHATDSTPYLIDSRWSVRALKREEGKFRFTASGFGAGEMRWQVPAGRYRVTAAGKTQEISSEDNVLTLTIEAPEWPESPISFTVQRIGHA